jgi:hypothetical protein
LKLSGQNKDSLIKDDNGTLTDLFQRHKTRLYAGICKRLSLEQYVTVLLISGSSLERKRKLELIYILFNDIPAPLRYIHFLQVVMIRKR